MNHQRKIQHLYWRAGFGARLLDVESLQKKNLSQVIRDLFSESESYQELKPIAGNSPNFQEIKAMSKEQRQELRKSFRPKVLELNKTWMAHLVVAPAQLREKMTLFWHDHFACQSRNPFHAQKQINTLRKHALGNFGDLVLAIAKDPAMLQFLNNQQNRKRKPNENFARELMELFTLGRGNYTEKDIKESARAFTGWAFNGDEYIFRPRIHDFEEKTFMGKTGNFNGDDIIRIILENPQTARYITTKIYKYFVNEKPHTQRIEQLSQAFYQSNYDIKALMQSIFQADWFYAPENVGNKIKSPIELIIGYQRNLPLSFNNKEAVIFLQKVLGQMLLFPPNVAGWPDGRSWIDSSTLMTRVRLPEMLYFSEELNIQAKAEGDADKKRLGKRLRKLGAHFDWEAYLPRFKKMDSKKEAVQFLSQYLLQSDPASLSDFVESVANTSSQETFIKTATLAICTLPEYQLC